VCVCVCVCVRAYVNMYTPIRAYIVSKLRERGITVANEMLLREKRQAQQHT
jgi:hypothetical protein